MNAEHLSWDDIRLILAAGRANSLSEFAQELSLDPTTASRRSKMLEATLRLSLFERAHGVLRLTAEGRQLLQHAQRMEEAALAFRSSARKLRKAPEGQVRISAPPTLARFVLAPGVVRLHQQAPGITVEIETEPANVRLEKWQADIAVRLGSPKDVTDTVLVRKLGRVDYAIFEPSEMHAPLGWAAYSTRFSHVPEAAFIERALGGQEPVMRANDPMLLAQAASAGAARTVLPVMLGRAVPGLRQAGDPVLQREVWSLRNADTGEASAVKTVHQWLVELFGGRRVDLSAE